MPVRRVKKTRIKGASLQRPRKRDRKGKFAANGSGILRLRSDIRASRRKAEGGLLDKSTINDIKRLTRKGRGSSETKGGTTVKSAKLKMNKTRKQRWGSGRAWKANK